jgi:hypothetical protein
MNDLRNEKIDRIERKLLKARKLRSDELREIVSEPRLFERVKARIEIEQAGHRHDFEKRARRPVWNWRKAGLAFAGLAVLFAGVAALNFITMRNRSFLRSIERVAAPEIRIPVPAIENPEIFKNGSPEIAGGGIRISPEKIAFNNKKTRSAGRGPARNAVRKQARVPRSEPEEAFYPLAFTENLEEAKEDGRVIRVELSRSSLLALGLNPPMEDEVLKIKTDLLIGSDGVARGIRFVK